MIGTLIGLALLLPRDPNATYHGSDAIPALDPMRSVSRVARDSFTLQYFTRTACETVVQVREGTLPASAFQGERKTDPWSGNPAVRVVRGRPGRRTFHQIVVPNLRPGRRYFYRISDPEAEPTRMETRWGAARPWGREYAVSTQAPKGQKTILHLPVKVLLMPNVVNVESAYADPASPAPMPAKLGKNELAKLRDEYAISSRVLWVASGMRLWVDYRIQVDERWQRWGPEPAAASGPFRGLPVNRSYPGRDFEAPGGGAFTIVDPRDPLTVHQTPIVEDVPFSAQIEQAFPRRWNPKTKQWDFYTSGGGTYGVDAFPEGTPGRSQFLGGGDTSWLATHEFHHDLESHGEFSLSNREDDRVVFDHPAPRRRIVKSDGSVEETAWSTSGRHGEHWDVIAFWDRQLTDSQWLRMYFGQTLTVGDADEDGFPDDDVRLPLDERRFGSSPGKKQTDGEMGDLEKAMLSNWAPGPLQPTWTRPPDQAIRPNPKKADTDGDGLTDREDPYPLYTWAPLIMPQRATIDGNPSEWAAVEPAAEFEKGGLRFTFKQSHDDLGYYGYYEIHGPWRRIDGTFDGEGKGVFSGEGVLGFQATREADGRITTRPTFGGAPGLKLASSRLPDGGAAIEFRLPNRGEGPWFWEGGGHEIGVAINVWDDRMRGYSAYEPYRLFYARMVEAHGAETIPTNPPPSLEPGQPGVTVYHPGDAGVEAQGCWKVDAGQGYIGFVGGYANTVTRLRLFGQERGHASVVMTPGRHTVQLSRRDGELWLLVDGKAAVYALDPNPKAMVDRLAVLGGYEGAQVVHEIRVKGGR